MEIRDFAYGNTVKRRGGKPLTLDTTLLGMYSHWKNTKYSKTPPFTGMIITHKEILKLGFLVADEKKVDADKMSFGNLYIYKYPSVSTYPELYDAPIYLGKDETGYRLLDVRFTDAGRWLESISKPLKFVHELQNAAYWIWDKNIEYEAQEQSKAASGS